MTVHGQVQLVLSLDSILQLFNRMYIIGAFHRKDNEGLHFNRSFEGWAACSVVVKLLDLDLHKVGGSIPGVAMIRSAQLLGP